jgi:hypothetical protein
MPQYSGMWTLSQVSQAVKNQTWTGLPPSVVEYLVVAGGGSGGGDRGGGGGAGGLLAGHVGITPGTSYSVTVGAGATYPTPGSYVQGGNGSNSVFGIITAIGGGGGSTGAGDGNAGTNGSAGGSGGGSTGNASGLRGGGAGISGQGFAGGNSLGTSIPGHGGGGAGGPGLNGMDINFGTNGGVGLASDISGTRTVYAGGGGGGSTVASNTSGKGGAGGGGNGGEGGSGTLLLKGAVNSGGGGGGSSNQVSPLDGGSGGSGIVIIRYPGTTQFFTGGTLSYANGYIIHTFYANGTLAPIAGTLYANPDYQIARSLRFNSADTAILDRTPAGATNRKTWTWSGWVKRGSLGTTQVFFVAGTNGSNYTNMYFSGSVTDNLEIFNYTGGVATGYHYTTSVFRDPSAWYHIVYSVDTTQIAFADRVKIYVNNVLQPVTVSTTFSQNVDTWINSANQHYIGRNGPGNASQYFDGYMTDVHLIDGQALTPSSFGWTNPATGVWAPLDFVGTYGTNGFNLNFSDNTNTTAGTLGADSSGNGNNWTPTNFSVSAGVGNDSLVDTPTSYGTDTGVGGEVRGNYCTFSPVDKATTVTLSNGNLDIIGTNSGGRARASMAVSSGKWYFEFLMVDIDQGGYNGFMATTARSDLTGGGATTDLGQNADTWGIPNFAGGQARNNGTNGANITGITNGQIGMFALDMDSGKFWYGINGTWVNSGDPATGANPVYSNLSGYTIAAAIGHGTGTYISYSYNFGQRAFSYTAPTGYKAMTTQNLPTPTIGATSATLANKFFNAITYSGNGSSSSNVTQIVGTPFYPDLVWLKGRSGGDSTFYHRLTSTGLTQPNYLSTNSTDAEGSVNDQISALASTHFQVKAAGGGGTNQLGSTYVAWAWNAGSGTSVTNTSGSITSSVSANPTSGFSVVTYTGTGSNATVGHGLGVAPTMYIVKARNDTSGYNWSSYHVALGNTQYIALNTTGAAASSSSMWNSTTPTSAVFSLGTNATVNTSSKLYVAYCFAEVAGYSKFGSYTGNGSTNGPFVFTGFRPRFILWKNSTSVYDWQIVDTARDTYNVSGLVLQPNASNAEADGRPQLDILSNGFKIRASNSVTNESASTIIYMAFAENPFKYSLAR